MLEKLKDLIGMTFNSFADKKIKDKIYKILGFEEKDGKTYVDYEYQWPGKKGNGRTLLSMILNVWYISDDDTKRTIAEILGIEVKDSKKETPKKTRKKKVKKTEETPKEEPKETEEVKIAQ